MFFIIKNGTPELLNWSAVSWLNRLTFDIEIVKQWTKRLSWDELVCHGAADVIQGMFMWVMLIWQMS